MIDKIKTMVSMGLSRGNGGDICLQIEDAHSGDLILDISMTAAEVGLLVTGLYGVKGVSNFYPKAKIAMSREIKRVECEKVSSLGKLRQVDVVNKDFSEKYSSEGWDLQCDGCRSQQNSDMHIYIIKRYKKVDDVMSADKYY